MTHATAHRFLIVRLGSLGDVIHGIPVAAALRERFPSARIDWLVDHSYVELLEHVEGIDTVIPADPRHHPLALMSTLRALRKVEYTAVIDLQGLIKSAMMARAVGAWRTIGFPGTHLRESAARFFYTDVPEPGGHMHVVLKNLGLLAPLGVRELRPMFPIAVPVTAVVEQVVHQYGAGGYALINPGAAWPNKRWPPARFGAVAAALAASLGLRSLVLWGPREESLAAAVAEAAGGAADVAPPTTSSDVFGIARGARVMISGDTGPLHLAAAVGTPVVGLFGPTSAERNGPWAPGDIPLTRTDRCSCLYKRRCRKRERCIDDIGVDEVVAAVGRRLAPQG